MIAFGYLIVVLYLGLSGTMAQVLPPVDNPAMNPPEVSTLKDSNEATRR